MKTDESGRRSGRNADEKLPRGIRVRVIDDGRKMKALLIVAGKLRESFETEKEALESGRAIAALEKKFGEQVRSVDLPEWERYLHAKNRYWEGKEPDWAEIGRLSARKAGLQLSVAAETFRAAKKAEGVSEAALGHYKKVYGRFAAAFPSRDSSSITRDEISAWLAGLTHEGKPVAPQTLRTHAVRVITLFRWLVTSRLIDRSPCDGLKPPKVIQEEVKILTVEHVRALLENNQANRELCGRMALECFAGLRFSSAAKIAPADIEFSSHGIVLPAAKIKTRRRQFIDGLPANLWAWLDRADVPNWKMTPRQYLFEKSAAFGKTVPHPHNGLRHSFGSYHMALHKDASKTAAILCHTTPKTLYLHYKGRATEAQGKAYFEISPPIK